MKILLLASFLLLVPINALATEYYVDYDQGSDTNSGTSMLTPIKHCPGDPKATKIAASLKLVSGDRIIFKGNTIYKGSISLNWSGSSNKSRIVYDGNTNGQWGTGKAILDGACSIDQAFYGRSVSYITIDGFEIRSMNKAAIAVIGNRGPSYGLNIKNCYIHHIGHWQNDGLTATGSGISIIRSSSGEFSNNVITKTGKIGICLPGGQDNVVVGNTINSYIVWGIDISSDYRQAVNNVIKNNTIYDLFYHDVGFRKEGSDQHTDFIFIRKGGGTANPDGNIIDGNLFYNNFKFIDYGGTVMVYTSYADNTIIMNNVFINPHSYYALSSGWLSRGTKIYNNTFYTPRSIPILLNTVDRDVQIKNNIFINSGAWLMLKNQNALKSLKSDNNLWLQSKRIVEMSEPYSKWSVESWRDLGFDGSSIIATATKDIGFQSENGYPTQCNLMDLDLRSNSIAIDKGAKIKILMFDKAGIKRPQNIKWDIGAYEYKY